MMNNELSILIPNYNSSCVELVEELQRQALQLGINYEIIVADDASPDKASIQPNEVINTLPHCRFILKESNTGSAATRNFLAQNSQYRLMLFLDADIHIPNDRFLSNYLQEQHEGVVNGGISICTDDSLRSCLRYLYEKEAEPLHTAEKRQQNKYQEFRSTNFIIDRESFQKCPFDERFTKSGYEDVLFGKNLKQKGIPVTHIDNPVIMRSFENNPDYMAKMERNLRTLHQFRDELRGYSRLLTFDKGIHIAAVRWLIKGWHLVFGQLERKNLCGPHPNLRLFSLYKLGYYLSLN
jgi:glycosyltransferase involved in cell wall biosynthesis